MHRRLVAIVLGATLFAAGCSSSGVDAVESDLATHFIVPLQAADISYVVEDTCHLRRDAETEPWHLEVRVAVEADHDQIAQLFEAEDVVLDGDRDPMTIQQEPGDPARGWNGVLEARGAGASWLGLTYNNVVVDGAAEAGGWAEVCRLADQQ